MVVLQCFNILTGPILIGQAKNPDRYWYGWWVSNFIGSVLILALALRVLGKI